MVDGENQVIEIDETTTSPISPIDEVPSGFDSTDSGSSILQNDAEKDIGVTGKEEQNTILLDKLRTAIRSGDKTIHFAIDGDESSGQRSRRPKFDRTSDNTLSAIKSLREETEKSNKNFLMSVFSRVNGGKRKRRHTKYILNRRSR